MTTSPTKAGAPDQALDDLVFVIREGEWRVRINGRVLPTIWNSRGAAVAGLNTERARIAAIAAAAQGDA